MKFSIIVAADEEFGIGKDNALPWRLNGDLAYFSRVTRDAADGKRNAVIMGRKTWESIPEKRRPLAGRLNVVLSRQGLAGVLELAKMSAEEREAAGIMVASSLEEVVLDLGKREDVDEVFVIGGDQIYAQAVKLPGLARIYLTAVKGRFGCDAFFPQVDEENFKLVSESEEQEEDGVRYSFCLYERAGEDKI